jgi:hypothetical protein
MTSLKPFARSYDSTLKPNRSVCCLVLLLTITAAETCLWADTRRLALQNSVGLSVEFDAKTGMYFVKYKAQLWFGPGFVSVLAKNRWYRSANTKYPEPTVYKRPQGTLVLAETQSRSGSDRLGAYDDIRLTWHVLGEEIRVITGFRLYRDKPYLVFTQEFPNGFKNYASGNWITPSVVFPQFLPDIESSRHDLYSWVSGGLDTHRFAYGPATSLGGTVDVLVVSDNEYNTAILSPFANYLVATQQNTPVATMDESDATKGTINCGIEGMIQNIPRGFEHEHILVVGQGVESTFRIWGDVLLARAGKKVPSKYADDNMRYVTYWDDYGAYYREHGFKEDGYATYEDIILGIAGDAKKHGLRIGAYQVQDSDQMLLDKGLFEPRPDLFPHGLKWLHEQLGAPLEAYVAWIAPGGPYRKKYSFFETPKGNILGWPSGSMGDIFYSADYWRDTANKLTDWGAILLQQDYMSSYEGDPVMMADLDRMNLYYKNEAKALQEKGIKMQYCMTLPRNIMQSTENPIVLSLQASRDHHVYTAEPKPEQRDDDPYVWKHLLFASALYGAVGLWPSRDNIQTVADPNAFEDVLIANMMGGEIQLGHRIGECNFDLVRKTYREGDGLLLKPDRPLVPLDRCYHENCAAGYTESEKDGHQWFYVVSFPISGYLSDFKVADIGVESKGKWVVYDYDSGSVSLVDPLTPIYLKRDGKHQFLVIAPLFENGIAVLGDTDKFVTMADMRIQAVEAQGSAVQVGVISDPSHSPIVTGYASKQPSEVESEGRPLPDLSSPDRIKAAQSGWCWDPETKLWFVKMDFGSAPGIGTKTFTIF